MVAPVTFPTPTTIGLNADAWNSWKRYKAGSRQKKPFNLNLTYTYQKDLTVGARKYVGSPLGPGLRNRMSGFSPAQMRSFSPRDTSEANAAWQEIDNRLSGKFVSEWRSHASLGVSLAEGRQAWGMMLKRITQLVTFGNRLRKFDFNGAAKALGVLKSPEYKELRSGMKLRRGSHSFANNYLEFHFGWSPLMGDLDDCMNVLSSDIPLGRYKTRSGTPIRVYDWSTTNSSNLYIAKHYIRCFGSVGADIRVTNPNLYLYASLGLTNPAAIAWELVPFSFVVDWFVGVNSFLESYSQYHGVAAENIFLTKVWKSTAVSSYFWRQQTWYPWTEYIGDFVSQTIYVTRSTSLPQVTLKPKLAPLFEDKPRRALAACSLLIQQFVGKR